MTITEALAELKTLQKRILKKKEFIKSYLWRPEGIKDPLEKDSGSVEALKREFQALNDLRKRFVTLRVAIQKVNFSTPLTIEGITLTVSEWLTWRKEISAEQGQFYTELGRAIQQARTQAQQRGNAVVQVGAVANNPSDVLINIDEGALGRDAETHENILGQLDGKLSLLNATTQVELQ